MAGDWIVWQKGLVFKRETAQIARAIHKDRHATAAYLMRIWEWADAESTDGQLHGVGLEDIDAVVSVRGIGAAMREAGWLLVHPDGVAFPNFDRWNTSTAKERLQSAERSQRYRSRHTGVTPEA